jgi:predicted nuclease of restriction endonuclease-like (RecB) superfamily
MYFKSNLTMEQLSNSVKENAGVKFDVLVNSIEQTHQYFYQRAIKAVNVALTLRNWLIGCYIVEFEQNGADRAKYGTRLVDSLADRLKNKGLGNRNLKLFRQFYLAYPELYPAIHHLSHKPFFEIMQLSTAQLDTTTKSENEIVQSPTARLEQRNTNYLQHLVQQISFTHFAELIKIEDKTKRAFFELLVIKTTPSVQELRRQINTLAFERVGLSENMEFALEQLQLKIEPQQASDAVKSVFLFDFLGINTLQLIEENELETALINHLQEFLIELGHGFCFEARQKRILIDDEYYFVDLVFYHRILKCHILVELKIDAFKHEHLSQLNTYVSYFREEVKRADDNPPIGILLCTQKGTKLVEYALSGMDNQLFVSKYMLELPKKEQLEAFITSEIAKWSR